MMLSQTTSPSFLELILRPALVQDADSIAATFLESAEFHACLDPERYSTPSLEAIAKRYREGWRQSPQALAMGITLVAELQGEVIGFIEARLEQSPDEMHRRMIYCHVAEIAVSWRYRNQGIGERLLRAAEEWGRSQGARFASLEHHAANTRAGGFYQQRMGYSVAAITLIKRL